MNKHLLSVYFLSRRSYENRTLPLKRTHWGKQPLWASLSHEDLEVNAQDCPPLTPMFVCFFSFSSFPLSWLPSPFPSAPLPSPHMTHLAWLSPKHPSLPPRCHPVVTPSHSHSLVSALIRLTSENWRRRAPAFGIGRERQPPSTRGLLSRVDMWYKISVLSPLHSQVCTRKGVVCICTRACVCVCVSVCLYVHGSRSERVPTVIIQLLCGGESSFLTSAVMLGPSDSSWRSARDHFSELVSLVPIT